MERLGSLPPRMRVSLPAAASQALVDRLADAECPALTTRRARRAERAGAPHDPIVWSEAAGCNVLDADGNRYLDLSAGFGAAAVGHAHPQLVAAVQAQAARLPHALGDLHPSDVKVALLQALQGLAPFEGARVMLGLHGSDAVEAALKTATLHTGRAGVLGFTGGYHGLSYGALAVSGYSAAFRAPFAEALSSQVCWAPYPDADQSTAAAIAQVTAQLDAASFEIGAVLVEPVLGRGGMRRPPAGFVAALGELARSRGALLIVDEVMTGLGRGGAMLRHVQDGAQADLICLGKALGGGLPVSACIGRPQVMQAWGAPDGEAIHTHTFAGNPLGCAAALAALEITAAEGLCARATDTGARLLQALSGLRDRHACVTDARGAGLMLGLELRQGAQALALGRALLEQGYITVPAGADARVLSLTPPLAIEWPLLQGFVQALDGQLGRLA